MTAHEISKVQNKLITIENYTMEDLWGRFIGPAVKETYTHEELFSDFVPSMAVFEGVPVKDAFAFLAITENMALWTMSMRNLRLLKDDIYEADEDATPTGKVFVRTIANAEAQTIEWRAGHADPDDLWIYYRGILTDAEAAMGRKGTAFFWTNFVHKRVKQDPMLAIGFKAMYAAHEIEINNLKMILENNFA
ncbi:MAG: hypothetical protein ACC641_10780 [Acidiferrobacterales bacterium]